MNSVRTGVITIGLLCSVHLASAQDLSRYRDYALESSLESVIAASGARAADTTTIHDRPARIQQLDWRAPYVSSSSDEPADPVRQLTFSFLDDALYQVVVTYDRDRTDGLTNADIIESLSKTYGPSASATSRARSVAPDGMLLDAVALAHWENATSLVTLLRGAYTPEFQLIVISKPLSARALSAIREAKRLDSIDAPRREAEQRKQEAAAAAAARAKTRTTNKDAFRP